MRVIPTSPKGTSSSKRIRFRAGSLLSSLTLGRLLFSLFLSSIQASVCNFSLSLTRLKMVGLVRMMTHSWARCRPQIPHQTPSQLSWTPSLV
ncbi:hypothetical protein C8R42DRAFT_662585 [Lentinula raphanica]|nr:hypothetical protein C8R42DRAFT_692971 [Lentinula raphanica]KAJ3724720.1 hypothetical protein C8R42DRAFT_662585 [Lentinula raphanica]